MQVYNLNVQRTIPLSIVFNIGYNGSRGANLDVVGSPKRTPARQTIPGVAAFDYDRSIGFSRSNQLVISANKRQHKGIALGATYTYGHTIDNASGVGGRLGTPIQNFYRLDLEEGNSSFDQRHNLTGNWVTELPFGPNRAFLNKGGVAVEAAGWLLAERQLYLRQRTYFTPQYPATRPKR